MNQYNRGGFFASIPFVIRNIIGINALMLILTMINREFMLENFALFFPASQFFKPWQIITHIFMHGNFGHLLFNMYALWMFGSILEQLWGPKKFLLYYLVTGLGAAAMHMGVQWIEASSLVKEINENGMEAMGALSSYRMLMNTPSPVPFPGGLVVKKGSKIFSSCSFGIPQPVSLKVSSMESAVGWRVAIVMVPSRPIA